MFTLLQFLFFFELGFLSQADARMIHEVDLPTYKLKPGIELDYAVWTEREDKNGIHGFAESWTFFVLEKKPLGWDMVAIRKMSRGYIEDKQQIAELKSELIASLNDPKSTTVFQWLAKFQLDHYGRISQLPIEEAIPLQISHLLPVLPLTNIEIADGWKYVDTSRVETITYRTKSTINEMLTIEADCESLLDSINSQSVHLVLNFDLLRGIPTGGEKLVRTINANGAAEIDRVATSRLSEVKTLHHDFVQHFSRDVDEYISCAAEYEWIWNSRKTNHSELQMLFDREKQKLSSLAQSATSNELRSFFNATHRIWERRTKNGFDSIITQNKLIGNPAPDWQLMDFDGNEVKLQDYRGRVVVL